MPPRGGKRKGSGRPSKYKETVSRSFRIPTDLNERIQKKANKLGVSWSDVVIQSLSDKI